MVYLIPSLSMLCQHGTGKDEDKGKPTDTEISYNDNPVVVDWFWIFFFFFFFPLEMSRHGIEYSRLSSHTSERMRSAICMYICGISPAIEDILRISQ